MQSHEKLNRRRDLFQEAQDQDFLVGNALGSSYMIPNTSFDAAMVDLTNPGARTWLKGIFSEMVQTGVRGWMADFGEALPLDSSLSSSLNLLTTFVGNTFSGLLFSSLWEDLTDTQVKASEFAKSSMAKPLKNLPFLGTCL